MLTYTFYFLAFVTVFCAIMVVASKNPVHSVLFLVLAFFGISANYIFMLDATFVGIVNIIVYAGAIMVLFLYVIMLMNLNAEIEPVKSNLFKICGVIAGGALLLIITAVIRQATPEIVNNKMFTNENIGSMRVLGRILYTDYILPFEVASILFLIAMVGAVILGRKEKAALTVGNTMHDTRNTTQQLQTPP
ncbi:MAG TPA: NADH-quinone oxidoreductase subunit J [Chitinophagales bacterium]|nr:NADH-quinone oxidoreductase subunit J [Chitinophagales bacterium]